MTNRIDTAAERAKLAALEGHTPGPWVAESDNGEQNFRPWVGNIEGGGWSALSCGKSKEQAIANARLIAAAPDLKAAYAVALEAERAKVAAAYEAVASVCRERHLAYEKMTARAERSGPSHPDYICDSTYHHWSGKSSAYSEMQRDFRALTPADAQAALDKMLAEARLEGWLAGRDAAAHACDWGDIYGDNAVRAIRALPEPKEANHDD